MKKILFKSKYRHLKAISLACIMVCSSTTMLAAPLPKWAEAPSVNDINTLPLKESVLRSFGQSPSIAQQAAQIGIGEAQIREAQSSWYPQISLGGSAGHSKQTDSGGSLSNSASYGLTLTQLVWDFGKTNSNIRQQKTATEGYRYALMGTMTSVAEQTVQAYIEVKRYQDLCAAVEKNLRSLEQVRDISRLRAEAGLNSSSDVLQAEVRIASVRSTFEQYQALLDTAKSDLAVLTGVRAAVFPDLPRELTDQPVAVNNISYETIPAVLEAQAQNNAAEYGIEKARAGHFPTVSVQGGRTRYQNSSRSYWNDQLQLNVDAPLYQGGAVNAQIEQAEGTRRVYQSMVNQAKLDVLQKASSSYSDWTGAQGREKASSNQLRSAIRTRDVYQNEYKLSKRSLSDLLSVEQDVFSAEASQINADYDGWKAAVSYAAVVDNLLPLIGIERTRVDELPNLK